MNIIIEKFTSEDIPKLISWIPSKEFLQQWCGKTFEYPITESQLIKYLEWTETAPALRYVFKATDAENNLHIGNITLELNSRISNAAALTCIIVGEEKYKSKGVANKMINHTLDITFNVLQYENVYLNVYKFNKPAIKCYKKAGFSKVSENDTEYADKKEVNYLMMIRKPEWQKKK